MCLLDNINIVVGIVFASYLFYVVFYCVNVLYLKFVYVVFCVLFEELLDVRVCVLFQLCLTMALNNKRIKHKCLNDWFDTICALCLRNALVLKSVLFVHS